MFDFEIVYRKGVRMGEVDCLSRLIAGDDATFDMIAQLSEVD